MLRQLVEQYQRDNSCVWKGLLDQFANGLFRVGLRYVRNEAEAEWYGSPEKSV